MQGIIAARLDALEPEQKSLLQDAAAIGKTFWLGAACAISGMESRAVETSLHVLERGGFVRRERETSIAGDTEYAFLHILVREVAYGQIPRASRAEKHRQAAEWIESLGRPEDHAEMLVYHYGEALALAGAAGIDMQSIREPARRALRDAGDRAMALNAYAPALRFYEQAIELWPEDDPDHAQLLFARAKAQFLGVEERRTDLLAEAKVALLARGDRDAAAEAGMLEAMALKAVGGSNDAFDVASRAAALLDDAPASSTKAYVVANWARFLFLEGHNQDAMEVGQQMLSMADELGLGEVRASALSTIGMARMGEGDLDGIEDLEESLDLAMEHGSPFEITRIQNNLGVMYWWAGQNERGTGLLAARVEVDERFGLPRRFGIGIMVPTCWVSGRWDEAERYAGEFLADRDPHEFEPVVRSLRARIGLARDELSSAREDCARALDLIGDEWSATTELIVPTTCARVALASGRPAKAAELVERALVLWGKLYHWRAFPTVDLTLLLMELGRSCEPVLEVAREVRVGPGPRSRRPLLVVSSWSPPTGWPSWACLRWRRRCG